VSTTNTHQNGGSDHQQRLLAAPQAAKLLGYSKATLQRHREARLIPQPLRIGGAVRWDKQELEAWIGQGCPDADTWEAMKLANR
jgi:prophage regulatory protein